MGPAAGSAIVEQEVPVRDHDGKLQRRTLIAGLSGLAASARAFAQSPGGSRNLDDIPIIDAHIHLFDGTRPQGATYMGSRAYAAQSKVSLPSGYRPLAAPAGIVGAIVVESSAWVEDNLWYLTVAETDPIIVGVVGRLDTAKPEFAEYVQRYAKNPLYRGIRHSRYYRTEDDRVVFNPGTVEGMRLLADLDLVLDTANPSIPLMRANLQLADAAPKLRIVLDHLPAFDPTPENLPLYRSLVTELAARPNIFVKLTEVYHPAPDGSVAKAYGPIQEELAYLLQAFGEDRVMFGTDYPNSYGVATIPEAVDLMKRFYAGKRAAAEKYFWRNSARIYKWVRRTDDQPRL
jgi:predicted TIM-barrel fold metal-dependent hydrolase